MQPAKTTQEIYEDFAAARKKAGLPPLPMPSKNFSVDLVKRDAEEIQTKLDKKSEVMQKLDRIRAMCNKSKAGAVGAVETVVEPRSNYFMNDLIKLLASTLKTLTADIEAQTVKCREASSLTAVSELQNALKDSAYRNEEIEVIVSELIFTLTDAQKRG